MGGAWAVRAGRGARERPARFWVRLWGLTPGFEPAEVGCPIFGGRVGSRKVAGSRCHMSCALFFGGEVNGGRAGGWFGVPGSGFALNAQRRAQRHPGILFGRYWEAVTQLHFMYSKFADAFSQFYAFSEADEAFFQGLQGACLSFSMGHLKFVSSVSCRPRIRDVKGNGDSTLVEWSFFQNSSSHE